MRRETVETLAFGLPSASPYFRRVFGTWLSGQAPSERDRIEKALFDPAFGSNVAGSYAEAGQLLPDLEWPEAVRRAHERWSNPEIADDNLLLAECFSLSDNGNQRGVMRALLACEDGSSEFVADCLQCDAEAVTLFGELYWNVRDRRAEPS
jgi:hypothetical protein